VSGHVYSFVESREPAVDVKLDVKLNAERSWSTSTVDTECLGKSVPPTPTEEVETDFAFDVEHKPIETILSIEEVNLLCIS
jgi:hypothetical protein